MRAPGQSAKGHLQRAKVPPDRMQFGPVESNGPSISAARDPPRLLDNPGRRVHRRREGKRSIEGGVIELFRNGLDMRSHELGEHGVP